MRLPSLILTFIFAGKALAQVGIPPVRSEDELIDTLDQSSLQEAIRILLKSYIKRDNLDSLELNRAATQALQCPRKIEIVPRATHLFEEPGALERVAGLAAEWFDTQLAPVQRPPARWRRLRAALAHRPTHTAARRGSNRRQYVRVPIRSYAHRRAKLRP